MKAIETEVLATKKRYPKIKSIKISKPAEEEAGIATQLGDTYKVQVAMDSETSHNKIEIDFDFIAGLRGVGLVPTFNIEEGSNSEIQAGTCLLFTTPKFKVYKNSAIAHICCDGTDEAVTQYLIDVEVS